MRKISVVYVALTLSILGIALQSCQKNNGIVNNEVVSKPYTLYVVDSQGAVFNTNDGLDYKKTVFQPDGIPPRAIATSGENIIMIKSSVFVSENEGEHFNVGYQTPSASAFHQSMVIDVPSFEGRVYVASALGNSVAYSDEHGVKNSWRLDNSNPLNGASITSFTQLMDGTLVAFDDINRNVYTKASIDAAWGQMNGASLPGAGTGQFYITHYGNTVVAVDYTGNAGVWYSNDMGNNWAQYSGIPTGVRILSASAPFDRVLILGLEGEGIMRLPLGSTTFEPAINGLDISTSVHGIVAKSNTFKTNAKQQLVYIATNKGIYESEDNGENWIKVRAGNFAAIY